MANPPGNPSAAIEEDAGLAALLKPLGTAIEKSDAASAQAQFTPEAWSRDRDPGEGFYQQGVRKRFELRLVSAQKRGDRGVLTSEILREGKRVDRVFLYAIHKSGRWLIDAIDENVGHPEPYLAGHLAADFRVETLPQNPALLTLGTLIADAAQGKAGMLDQMYAQVVDTSSVGYLHLDELNGATCKAAFYLEPMARVALVFEKSAPTVAGGFPAEPIVLYLRKQEKMWHVYARSYGRVTAGALLMDNRAFLKR